MSVVAAHIHLQTRSALLQQQHAGSPRCLRFGAFILQHGGPSSQKFRACFRTCCFLLCRVPTAGPGRGFLNKETRSKSKGLHPQGNFGRGVRRTPSTLWERKRLPYSDRWKGRLLMREEASNSELCGFTSHKLQ